jgi:hypothetical protein
MKFLIRSWAPKSLLLFGAVLFTVVSCHKEIRQEENQQDIVSISGSARLGHLNQAKTYSAEVAIKWMNIQLQLMKTATGIPNVAFVRPFAYSGIALYEAVVPGMPAYQSLEGQLNGLSGLPHTKPGLSYHWPTSANAALAFINSHMFPNASLADKVSIDSTEKALNLAYKGAADAETINRSIAFGRETAQKIFEWAETDGYLHANDPYTVPSGPGLWVPPSIPLTVSSTPYWGNLRPIVSGSGNNSQPPAPTPYSTDPSSDFYKMAKQVYEASQTITPEQTAMALYWRDIPGVTTPGHYLSILKQVLEIEKPSLDKTAFAYSLNAITVFDAAISCWQTKYHYNLVRPVTYIRDVLGYTTWTSLLATPAHPEYASAHAVLSAANADVLTTVFGDNHTFTDHTYDYLGYASRSFNSFRAVGEDAANSRLYAGIHYQPSIDAGVFQGRKVAQNIINKLKFLK